MIKKLNQKGISAIVLAVVAVFLAVGAVGAWVYIQNNQSDIQDEVDQAEADYEASLTQTYPSLWGDLPEYPNATITKKRQGMDLNDGVQVTFQTNDDKATIKAFYDTELSNRSFTVPTTPDTSDTAYFGIYTKADNEQFTLQITPDGDDTSLNNVLVKYVEL